MKGRETRIVRPRSFSRRARFGLAAAALLAGLVVARANAPGGAEAAMPHPVTFSLGRVEDRYAINLPVFRTLFRVLDFGYAGCSIMFDVGIDRSGIETGANRKIEATVEVELFRPADRFTMQAIGSLERPEFEVYLANKCAEIDRVAIKAIKCYPGQREEFAGRSCPYRFEPGAYAIRRFYLDNQRA